MVNRKASFMVLSALFATIFQSIAISKETTAQDTAASTELSLSNLFNLEVTVASKKAESVSDAPGAIYVITQDEIRRTDAITLKEVLLRVPSVGIAVSAMSNRSLPVMRGDLIKTNSSHILFLLNGRPIREVQEGGVNGDLVESFPVDIIEQIEVIRGPGSVLYGSDAFSGVINIKTKTPADKPLAASATGHYEPATGGGASGNIIMKAGDVDVVAAARYYQKPDWKPEYHRMYFDWITTLRMQDSIVRGEIIHDQGPGFFLNANYKGLSATGSIVQWGNKCLQQRSDVTTKKYFSNLGYKTDIIDNWNTEVNATGVRTELVAEHDYFIERHSNNFLLENTHFFTPLKNLNIVAGGTVSYIEGREKYNWPKMIGQDPYIVSIGHRYAFSGYGQADYTLIEQVKLIGGLQVNKTKSIKKHIAPRIGVILRPTKEVSIKTFYSEAFRLPSINELFENFNIGLYGDPNLKPEIVKTFEQGISFQNDKFMVGVNYFYSMQKDIIQQVLFNNDGYSRKYSNLGTVSFLGAEFEGKWYVTKDLYLDGSLLIQNNRDSIYRVVPYADFGGKGGVSYSDARGFTLSLFDVYQGHMDRKFNGTLNNQKTAGAFQLLNFSSKFNLTKLFNKESKLEPSLLFKVDNIIGKEVWMYEYGGYSNDIVPTIRGTEFFIGLNLSL